MVILITGASSGFGLSIATRLVKAGHKVYGTSRKTTENKIVEGGCINYLQLDVRNTESVKETVKAVTEREGRIDVLINNAGMGIGGAIEMASDEEIELQMQTNFMGCARMCREVLPVMRSQHKGLIINLSSIGGVMGLPYQGFYSASKFAIEGYSEALSAEVSGFGIKVVMVEPGDFATNFTASRKNSKATLESSVYSESFKQSLAIIEKEETSGLHPDKLAEKIEHIINSKHPQMRYVVSNFEQWLSVAIKRILPGRMFVGILRSYYKVKP